MASKNKPKTIEIEDEYKKKTQRQHVYDLPDMYIGGIENTTANMYIFDDSTNKIVEKNIEYNPGLYKCYDEIVVNVLDHFKKDATADRIDVTVNKEEGYVKIKNNGENINISRKHKDTGLYVPTMIFCKLLTSSNYDKKGKTTGGKNGVGAKVTNVFSLKFIVKTCDGKQVFIQECRNNMKKILEPIFKPAKNKKKYTEITFYPDFKRFGMEGFSDDDVKLYKRRIYDVAMVATKSVNIFFNNEKLEINNFKDYVKLYYDEEEDEEDVGEDISAEDMQNKDNKIDKRKYTFFEQNVKKTKKDSNESNCYWRVCAVYDPLSNERCVSFVNGVNTFSGGKHVSHVYDVIIKKLIEKAKTNKQYKDIDIKPKQIRDYLHLFIDCVIEDPKFDGQAKSKLESKPTLNFEPSQSFINNIYTTGIVDEAIRLHLFKEEGKHDRELNKRSKNLKDLLKLIDATDAGKKNNDSTLILVEGDSARQYIIGGFSIIGNKKYGVYPLRGKLLNVREVALNKLINNKEIIDIIRIMGLERGKEYADTSSLRYKHIVIITDADVDGKHIKGLIINFIHAIWPSLIDIEGFIQTFNTPIIKAFKGSPEKANKNPDKDICIFYNLEEYKRWEDTNKNEIKKWYIKYYKGLGTSTGIDARVDFKDFAEKIKSFRRTFIKNNKSKHKNKKSKKDNDDKDNGEDIDDYTINMAFDKKMANNRKTWLNAYATSTSSDIDTTENNTGNQSLDSTSGKSSATSGKSSATSYKQNSTGDNDDSNTQTYADFINTELVEFSRANCVRAIPSCKDGFKPSQRKIFYGACYKKIFKNEDEVKVSQLAGSVSEVSEYHHGEVSLVGAIVNMAQQYAPGFNNINLLYPSGQFGSRSLGGKNHAQARYIFTYVTSIAQKIFKQEDWPILKKQFDSGKQIEPDAYAPIIPMVLVNGVDGIGTGYSSNIPQYNPEDIINNIKRMLNNKKPKNMIPWYRWFKGTITEDTTNGFTKYICKGIYEVDEKNEIVKISELPIGVWTENYKATLNKYSDIELDIKSTKKDKIKKNGKKESKEDIKKKKEKSNLLSEYTVDEKEVLINITLHFKPGKLAKLLLNNNEGLEKKFLLRKNISINNMNLHDNEGKIKKYKNVMDILTDYYEYRLDLYKKRKDYILRKLKAKLDILKYKRKFIKYVIDNKIIINKRKKVDIIEDLVKLKFPKLSAKTVEEEIDEAKNIDTEINKNALKKVDIKTNYNYITDIPLFNLTYEEIKKLDKEYDAKTKEYDKMFNSTPEEIWLEDIEEFEEAYAKWTEELNHNYDILCKETPETKNKKNKSKNKKNNNIIMKTKR